MKLTNRGVYFSAEGGLSVSHGAGLWTARVDDSSALVIDPDGTEQLRRGAWLNPVIGIEWGRLVIRWREP